MQGDIWYWGAHTTWLVNLQGSFYVRKQSQVRIVPSKSRQSHKSQQAKAILSHYAKLFSTSQSSFIKLNVVHFCFVTLRLVTFKKTVSIHSVYAAPVLPQHELLPGKTAVDKIITNYSSCSYFWVYLAPLICGVEVKPLFEYWKLFSAQPEHELLSKHAFSSLSKEKKNQ